MAVSELESQQALVGPWEVHLWMEGLGGKGVTFPLPFYTAVIELARPDQLVRTAP